ncbi:connectin [Caerostris extrusa]|uniref:Connectin n=1 Tax=Caerostris extrusa TaxID=172846 RepID=A0AAV4QLP1_CAEEX|nr:connectin [Caerostris extrusa]
MLYPFNYFSVFSENPFRCDCSLHWVKTYIKTAKSHQFTKELKELRCKPDGEDQTLQEVHLMKTDCDKFMTAKQKTQITTSRSVTQPVNLVPYEIHGRKNKTRQTAAVVTEDLSVVQDSEEREEMVEEMEKNHGTPDHAATLISDVRVVVFVALWTLFSVRWRNGT